MEIQFDNPDILYWLDDQPNNILDTLQFGVVKMDLVANVVYYNKEESAITGVLKENAIGKNFFAQIAPCTNNFLVAEKYRKEFLDEQVQYVFTYVTQPIPVLLRMLKGSKGHQYLLVKKI
jgi:photoactive yellow protein